MIKEPSQQVDTDFKYSPSLGRKVVLVIPCHRPSPELPAIVAGVLARESGPQAVVVVDDGNGPDATPILERLAAIPGVTLLRHPANMGVGAALKTGSRYVLQTWPDAHGVVSADADGQHAAADIVRVIETLRQSSGCVVLGVRRFEHAPLRSRFGNILTAVLFRLLAHRRLSDTQTGLRGWPIEACARNAGLAPNGFEYLLECLLAAREPFVEVPIRTIYLDGNRSSHFNPLLDSLRIYFVLLRYCASSLLAWAIDACVFYPVYFATGNLIASQFSARIISATAVFFLVRNLVFRSNAPVPKSSVRYAVLVGLSGFVSYSLIRMLHFHWGFAVAPAKLLSETALFVVNFAVQRRFIFISRRALADGDGNGELLDWTAPSD
jgi:glycosyltransferase involved in cell wall biosynthesis